MAYDDHNSGRAKVVIYSVFVVVLYFLACRTGQDRTGQDRTGLTADSYYTI
jgi:hypothetical protein